MSTRAIVTILSKDGESNVYTRGCDGYPSGIFEGFPKGDYTYEQLRKALHLEDYFESTPDYFYDFDLLKKQVSIYHPNSKEYPWTKGNVEFQGTIIDAIRKYVDADYSETPVAVTSVESILDILGTVFVPLSNIVFNELDRRLRPLFSNSSMYVKLSTQKGSMSRDGISVDTDRPIEETMDLPKLKERVSDTKSMWLAYSVSTAKEVNPSLQRFMICYHLELLSDSYRLIGIDKDFEYGTYPNPAEIYKVLNVIMDKVSHILENRIDAITYM